MSKLNKENRLLIPKDILELSNVNLNEEVRIYLCGKEILLDNPSQKHHNMLCVGKANIDAQHRLFVTKLLRNAFCLTSESNVICYVREGTIILRKVVFTS